MTPGEPGKEDEDEETLIAVGTTRTPKIRAVERALSELRGRFSDFLPGEILTRMMVSREEAFVRSLIHALAPFYNALGYGIENRD